MSKTHNDLKISLVEVYFGFPKMIFIKLFCATDKFDFKVMPQTPQAIIPF